MGTFQVKPTTGFSSRMREKFQRQVHLHKSVVFVEDKSRKYEFVDNNLCWVPESPLIERRQLLHTDERQLRQACRLLCQRIEKGELAPEPMPQFKQRSQSQSQPTAKTQTSSDPPRTKKNNPDIDNINRSASNRPTITNEETQPTLKRSDTTTATNHGSNTTSLPVINEMLRGLESDLEARHNENNAEKKNHSDLHSTSTIIENNLLTSNNPTCRKCSAFEDDASPQHIEKLNHLTSTPTVSDTCTSFEKKSGLMRRLSLLSFGKRKSGNTEKNTNTIPPKNTVVEVK
ncbi:hypothetical protein BGW36DRAFT_405257 [Talaromyces proteolyticus]|uniref:Uncharacterized protein n=1 Tax=Talaromyces proteolyticus TaxID=1131652 RepID=A0AAD4KY89_9EURO|nr:uncharacterized protein BGW36DRAFT_405257 [Talaromyces proteolyticus]KAH8702481.1 hypothetical protein BGW36DRAFT_405257 [Talaromyces proteolyticus]